MSLKAAVTTLEDVPDHLREYYTADEASGVLRLNVEPVGGYALEDVSGLKSALGKERTTREKLERDVIAFKDIDPAKARTALAELEELKALDPAKEADKIASAKFEAAKTQLLEKHNADIGERDGRIKTLSGAVDGLVREQRATAAIAEAKGAVDLLLPHVLRFTRTVERDGKFSVEVIDADGNGRIADSKGSPMTIKDLVAEMRQSDTFGRAFDGDGHSGSGKQQDSPGGQSTKGDFGGNAEERRAAIAQRFKLKE